MAEQEAFERPAIPPPPPPQIDPALQGYIERANVTRIRGDESKKPDTWWRRLLGL